MTSFFWPVTFRSSPHRRRKLMAYFESWGNSEQETRAFYVKILIWKFDLIWPDWPPSKARLDDVIGLNDCHHRYLRAKWPRKQVSHGMFVTSILWWPFVTWPRLFVNMPFVLTQYPFWTHIQHFGWVWLNCNPSNRPEITKRWKHFIVTFDMTLTWHATLILKMD